MHYLHRVVSGPDAPLSLSLVFPSPCSADSPLTYHTTVHQYSKLVLGAQEMVAELIQGRYRGDGITPVGARAASRTDKKPSQVAILWDRYDHAVDAQVG